MPCVLDALETPEGHRHDREAASVFAACPELLGREVEGGDNVAHIAVRNGLIAVLCVAAKRRPGLFWEPNWMGALPEQIRGAAMLRRFCSKVRTRVAPVRVRLL